MSFFSFFFSYFFNSLSDSAIPTAPLLMPAVVTERLARFETTSIADREVMADLTQKIARLEAENRSIRQWTSDRFMAMWEASNGRDVHIVQALHDIHALQVEENGRQIRMQCVAEKLEALLRMPASPPLPASLPHPTSPPHAIPPPEPTTPDVGAASPTPMEDTEGEIPVGDSKKRGGSVGLESEPKRQKL